MAKANETDEQGTPDTSATDLGENAEQIEHGKTTDAATAAATGEPDDSSSDDETGESVPVVHVSDPDVPNDVEVAARSADMDKPSDEHRKAFVLAGLDGKRTDPSAKNPYTEANGFDHEPNYAATRQGAINAGLWPTEPVRFISAKRHPDGTSWVLTYGVKVVPAHDVVDGGTHPEVVGDDTDKDGATKAANADEGGTPAE